MFRAVELIRPQRMTIAIGAWISLPGSPADMAIASTFHTGQLSLREKFWHLNWSLVLLLCLTTSLGVLTGLSSPSTRTVS